MLEEDVIMKVLGKVTCYLHPTAPSLKRAGHQFKLGRRWQGFAQRQDMLPGDCGL